MHQSCYRYRPIILVIISLFTFSICIAQNPELASSQPPAVENKGAVEKNEVLPDKQIDPKNVHDLSPDTRIAAANDTKSTWRVVTDNLVGLVSSLAAVIAAVIAFLSFFFNYRSTIRNQRDSQFYEALKRVSDRQSSASRLTAVSLIAQMSKVVDSEITRTLPLIRHHKPYLETSVNQLSSLIRLEDDPIVLKSISKELKGINVPDRKMALDTFYTDNKDLQWELFDALAAYCGFFNCEAIKLNDVDKGSWQVLTLDSYFFEYVLKSLIRRHKEGRFIAGVRTSCFRVQSLSEEAKLALREEARSNVRAISARLRANMEVLSELLRQYPFPDERRTAIVVQGSIRSASILPAPVLDLRDVFLFGENFSGLDLSCIGLVNAQLIQCDFTHTKFRGAWLDGSDFGGSRVQFADFSDARLMGAILNGVKAYDANFSSARLNGTSFQEFTHPVWGYAEASLSGANLKGADLTGCLLNGARLESIEFDESTRFDDANWWAADFGQGRHWTSPDIDDDVVERLWCRFPDLGKRPKEEFHPKLAAYLDLRAVGPVIQYTLKATAG